MGAPSGTGQEAPPEEPQSSPPRDLYATSDIRFVMTEVAKFGERIDNLAERLADLKSDGKETRDRLLEIEKGISFVKGAMWVFGGLFAIALVVVGVLFRSLFGAS